MNDESLLQNREGDRSRSGGGGDFQRSDSSPGSRPSSVLPDLLTSSPGQRQDKSTSEEVRSTRPSVHLCSPRPPHRFVRALAYDCYFSLSGIRSANFKPSKPPARVRARIGLSFTTDFSIFYAKRMCLVEA